MKPISRRQFVIEGGSALAFASLPPRGVLPPLDPDVPIFHAPLQHLTESGANLLLYLVNVAVRRDYLVPGKGDAGSYLVVQLPAQSLHEQYQVQAYGSAPQAQLDAELSGPSFLVFRLWPGLKRGARMPRELRIPHQLASLLDWSDPRRFELQVANHVEGWKTVEWPAGIGSVTLESIADVMTPKVLGFDLAYLERLQATVAKMPEGQYVSVLELPAGLLMTLANPSRDLRAANVIWRAVTNSPRRGRTSIRERRYELASGHRTVTERWEVEVSAVTETPATEEDVASFGLPPALRAIGLVRSPKPPNNPSKRPAACEAPTFPAGTGSYLPTLVDKAEIVYLSQLGKQEQADTKFDLRGVGAFRLTGLGASLKFHYKNYDTRLLPDSISLVEYEHHFQAGRDNYIKIARIGICPLTTLRMLHVKIAERRVMDGVSFLEYREYVEPIETERDFRTDPGIVPHGAGYRSAIPTDGTPEGNPISPASLRFPFSRVEARPGRSSPIRPVLDAGTPASGDGSKPNVDSPDPRCFWVYREDAKGEDRAGLLLIPHTFFDRNGASLGTKPVPILFLRRDFFCNARLVEHWLTSKRGDPRQSLRTARWDDGRLRVELNGDVVALTPDDPTPETPNKPNRVATDWFEYYFDVANPAGGGDNPFDTADWPVYPQMRHARAYLDHVQHYARAKRPSMLEYEPKYLVSGLNADAHFEKVVLRHTEEFVSNVDAGKADVTTLGGSSILPIEPDLAKGWTHVKETFRNAGESLGALVNPEPLLERISLTKSALSMPKSGVVKNATVAGVSQLTMDPRSLFSRADAELFGGIRLSDVLTALDLDEAPQYLLNKLPPPPSAAAVLAAIAANPEVTRAYEAVRQVDATVSDLRRQFSDVQRRVENARQRLVAAKISLEQTIPSRDKIERAARAQFEAARLAFFADLSSQLDQLRALATLEALRVLRETGVAVADAKLLDFLRAEAPAQAKEWLSDYKEVDSSSSRYKDLVSQFGQFELKITQLIEWYVTIQPLVERPAFDDAALRILASKAVILDASAAKLAAQAESVFRLYEAIKPRLVKNGQGKAERWRAAMEVLDVVRQLNGAHLKTRLARLAADGEDACRTLPPELFYAIGTLRGAVEQGERWRAELLSAWAVGPMLAVELTSDATRRQQLLESAIDRALERALQRSGTAQLVREMREAQAEITEALGLGRILERQIEEAIREQAEGFKTRFAQELERRLATLNDSEAIRDASDAYRRVTALLSSVYEQELTTNWRTTRFKPVDLGFLRFEPRSSPATRLEMRAGVRMRMNPMSNPPLAVSEEATAHTLLENFRITFLSVISVDFERVLYTAGTGKSTRADVKIANVGFAGSLSFVQALQQLLSGLVDGLRVELTPDHVAVGYESPTLDLSSPGFTFANFFVGVALQIHFDRKPVRLRFNLASAESKATIAAGIYGGSFFCALTMDTKRGVIGTDTALEMGAYFGIRFGPFRGHVKFMVGMRYIRDDEGVTLIGYFIAEGALHVWIVSVSARLYMGVKSHNSVVEGFCIASYRVKVGFLKKTFTAGYSKKIAGAKQNAGGSTPNEGARGLATLSASESGEQPSFREKTLTARSGDAPVVRGNVGALGQLARSQPELFEDDFEQPTSAQLIDYLRQHFAAVRS